MMRERSLSKRRARIHQIAFDVCLITGLSLPFLFAVFTNYISLDYWYDEIFTLRNYVFTPILKTISVYDFPNNHIFFNLINNLYLKTLGVDNEFALADDITTLRMLMLAYGMLSILYTFLIGKKFFSPMFGSASVIVLITTLPFYNIVMQVRGYGLSILLVSVLIYHIWSYEQHASWRGAITIAAISSLLIYTIPLNLYVLGALVYHYGTLAVFQYIKSNRGSSADLPATRYAAIIGSLLMGTMLGFSYYFPVLPDVVNNSFVKSYGMFNAHTIRSILPATFGYFLSGRYFLALIVMLGLSLQLSKLNRHLNSKYIFCLHVLILPFVFSYIRGDRPFLRVFVNLVPVFAVFAALNIHCIFNMVSARFRAAKSCIIYAAFIGALGLSCYVMFFWALQDRDDVLMDNIRRGVKSQDVYYNYYQAHYQPLSLIGDFARRNYNKEAPVILGDNHDTMALPFYLHKFGIDYRLSNEIQSAIDSHKTFYVVTACPYRYMDKVSDLNADVQCSLLNQQLSFHNILLCRRD